MRLRVRVWDFVSAFRLRDAWCKHETSENHLRLSAMSLYFGITHHSGSWHRDGRSKATLIEDGSELHAAVVGRVLHAESCLATYPQGGRGEGGRGP